MKLLLLLCLVVAIGRPIYCNIYGATHRLEEKTKTGNGSEQKQQEIGESQQSYDAGVDFNEQGKTFQRCSRQSIVLAKQALAHELNTINSFNSIWFNDLDKDELIDVQKESLGNIVMSGAGGQILGTDGRPLFELEASWFRPGQPSGYGTNRSEPAEGIQMKLLRRHPDRCELDTTRARYTYVFGLILGPIEHNLDLVYNLPKELRFSQPTDWTYGQARLIVPKMSYEITLQQNANYKLNSPSGCPLEVSDVTYLSSAPYKSQVSVLTSGLATTNQTSMNLERLFNDYTRPTVSSRLKQALKFYLNAKTLPLST